MIFYRIDQVKQQSIDENFKEIHIRSVPFFDYHILFFKVERHSFHKEKIFDEAFHQSSSN